MNDDIDSSLESEKARPSAAIVFGGLFLAIVALVLMLKDPAPQPSAESLRQTSELEASQVELDRIIGDLDRSKRVTMSSYSQLRTGMSYADAVEIIGAPGEELSRNDIAGNTTVMYSWANPDGSNMNAMFQNGGLVQKAQFGLR